MRVTHNDAKGQSVVVVIETALNAASFVDAAGAMITSVVNKVHPQRPNVPHATVVTAWRDRRSNHSNRIIAVTHSNVPCVLDCFDGLLVASEKIDMVPVELDAAKVADALRVRALTFATAIGVSAVGDSFAAVLWDEIVSEDRRWIEGAGEGYGVHHEWVFTAKAGIATRPSYAWYI